MERIGNRVIPGLYTPCDAKRLLIFCCLHFFIIFAILQWQPLVEIPPSRVKWQGNPYIAIMCDEGEPDHWLSCTLCRLGRQGASVLQRARQRKVDWPQKNRDLQQSPPQELLPYTSLDDAFESMLQYMSTSSRQCKRYFASSPPQTHNCCDKRHCSRFHSPSYPYRPRKHPLQQSENMPNVLVAPGTYAVTAGAWGKDTHQTHVVRLEPGQSVDLDFNL